MGYRIDISADPMDPNSITVTTPSGTTTQHNNAVPRSHANTPGVLSRSHTPHGHDQQPAYDPPYSPSFQNPQTAAAASVLGSLNNNRNPVDVQPSGEFNHAIHYLNKIKSTYVDDPDIYKQFLDILQTYQKEQKQLQEVGLPFTSS